MDFAVHPFVFATGTSKGLLGMLETMWVRGTPVGQGTIYIVSGFANYNGGVRFYRFFEDHIHAGGKVVTIFGGSTSQRLSSREVVDELLSRGVEVRIVNRKRLFHAKLYGVESSAGNYLVVTSGNFTGPGMSQNVEASVLIEPIQTSQMGFSWHKLMSSIQTQSWQQYIMPPTLASTHPVWRLLYQETAVGPLPPLEESQKVTLVVILGHHDTARINAPPGTTASLGSQYFWLSRDSYDFFPPLTIKNRRGIKATFSCDIDLSFIDIGVRRTCRVTFEAENNLDFRLGTGPLRNTGVAQSGDMAALTRINESEYQLRIIRATSLEFAAIEPYAVTFIGHRRKRYGYIPNDEFAAIMGITL